MKNEIKKDNDLLGKAINLTGLINYQDGSVVSRTIINKKTGTVTLFAFDKEQGLSEHTTPYEAMVNLLEGEAEITIGGLINHVRSGDIILLPANIPHSLKAITRYKMLLIMIKS